MPANPSREECLMASVAHASVVVFGPGIMVGVLIWLTQKNPRLHLDKAYKLPYTNYLA